MDAHRAWRLVTVARMAGGDVRRERDITPAPSVANATENLLHDVVVLEIKPLSLANKDNNSRSHTIWNQLWGLVS